MKGQPNRLDIDKQHAFHGTEIDRSKPLKFRLDGRTITGFAGDTVLSAILASGVDMVGEFGGQPIALSGRFSPAITLGQGKAAQTLPMERTPALHGAEFHTFGGGLRRLRLPAFGNGRRSLQQNLDHAAIASPWHDQPPHALITTDVIVVGGGVAGMTAALAAARAGASVTLLEASPLLGGSARYFGAQEGDETPDQTISQLSAAIVATEAITVMLRSQVLAVHSGRVRAHQVLVDGATVTGEVVDLAAPRIVLATGAIERLPVFPGNRMPRVMTTLEAYLLAERYGVWLGRSATSPQSTVRLIGCRCC
ncbi:MAG: FAD-dependent oxidoreductase [Devosia sp.]|uniref:FAD-dependent oxidoreductase n=1 Tax=Devosia sp. TaxID=1871048 RepID=UPI00260D0452|nr:FAD-dependent oxidoreductase [Devosia sp.]MDB5588322.1 FAD-dependent oxidoreductase [Devosia sp.]